MVEKISRRRKQDALILRSKGVSMKDTSNFIGIATRTIQRAQKKLETFGDIEGGYKVRGPKPKLTHEMLIVYVSFEYSNPL